MTRNMSQSITPLCTDTGFKTLREYLHASRLTEVEVPKDGLCILHAVHGALQSSHTSTSAQGLSKEKVKCMVHDEFLQHVDEYMPYSALSKEDTLAQLESWAQTGQYGSDSVDLILHILSQVLNLRILVVEETISWVTSLELLPHRQEKCSFIPTITSVILIKHGQHFNHTVFSFDKEHYPFKKESTYTGTTEPIIISSADDDAWCFPRAGPISSSEVCKESPIDCQRTDVPTTMKQSEAAYRRTDVLALIQQFEAACQQLTDVPTTMQQSEATWQRTDVPTTMQQSEAACQRTDVPTTMQQSASAYQRTDVPTTMQQSEAACQRTDVPTTMQQSEATWQRTDVPTTMQQSEAACQRTDVPTTMQQSEAACQRTDVPTTMQQSAAACQRTDVPSTMQQSEAACQRTDVPTTKQQSEAACQRTDVPTTMKQSEAAYRRTDVLALIQQFEAACQQLTDVPTTMQQSEATWQRTDVPTTMQQSEAACQRTDVPTTMQQSAAAYQRTDVPTTMQQSEAACQRTDVPTTMQQSEAACQRTDVPTTMQQEAQVPGTSAATDSPQRTGNIGNSGVVSGSHNPIIAGSGPVNISYNYKMEGPGVPAPRPQLSQRPDQEPKPRAPSKQDVGNKTRETLKGVYQTTGSYVQLLPGVDNDQMHIAGIYTKVQLKTWEGVAVVTGQKEETANSTEYAKIFRLRTRTDELIKRLIFFGKGGVGKSTIFDKIAYDWADEASEILKTFKLVFLLKMCALSQESDLVDSTFDQLLGEKSGIEKDELDEFILANPNEVLILLDGFDEMKTKILNSGLFGSILKALNRKVYQQCIICVSTRPSHLETLMSEKLVQNPCTHVEVLGFTDDDVEHYVRKFFEKPDPASGKALIQTIQKSNTLRDFATNPMLLLLMCLLWRESKQLPETTSRLFTEAVNYMFTRKDKDQKRVSDAKVSKTLNAIGQTALRGLMSANQNFSFQNDEFEPKSLDLALKAGILTKQRVIKSLESHNNIQFMHKTIQEYCAATYLRSIHTSNLGRVERTLCQVVPYGNFKRKLRQLCQTLEGVVSNEFLIRFCCGDNEKCMTDIVNLLDRKFNKEEPRYQSDVVQAICRNCFFESQSAEVPQCLTSDTHIPSTIDVRSDNDFRSLIYLLEIVCKSDSPTTQLARVEIINVSCMSRYAVSDLAFALRYMENLRDLRIEGGPLVKGDFENLSSICHLTILYIAGCNTLGGRAVEWAPHIKHLASLEKLQIKNCLLQGTDIEHIALAVGDMPKLTDLILDENQTLSGSADLWNKEMPTPITQHLKRLNLSKCNLTWKDFEYIASAVGDMPNLTDLILYGNRRLGGSAGSAKKLPKMTHLRRLDLGDSNLETTDIEHIASAVGDMPELTDLGLTFNGTLASSALLWAKELPKMKHLNRLDLTYCHLKETDIEHIAVAVRDMPGLTDLDLNGNWVFSDLDGLLSHFPSLRGHVKT